MCDYGAKVNLVWHHPFLFRLFTHFPGRVLERGTPAFTSFIATNDVATLPGTRSIIVVDVHQVGSSCGYSVPYYDFRDFRKTLNQFYEKKKQAFDSGKESESMER